MRQLYRDATAASRRHPSETRSAIELSHIHPETQRGTMRVAVLHLRDERPGAPVFNGILSTLNDATLATISDLGWDAEVVASGDAPIETSVDAADAADAIIVMGGEDVSPSSTTGRKSTKARGTTTSKQTPRTSPSYSARPRRANRCWASAAGCNSSMSHSAEPLCSISRHSKTTRLPPRAWHRSPPHTSTSSRV